MVGGYTSGSPVVKPHVMDFCSLSTQSILVGIRDSYTGAM